MTFARYFIPLIIEGNKRGIKSKLFFERKQKYNCPVLHMEELKDLSSKYNFEIHNVSQLKNHPDCTTFSIEGVGMDMIKEQDKAVVLTFMVDYRCLHKTYIDNCKNAIFPSEYMSNLYDCKSPKNLYLGSPKYDAIKNFKKEDINKKYKINSDKPKAFVILPKTRDVPVFSSRFPVLYESLHDLGYLVLTKTRGKDLYPSNPSYTGDLHFIDSSWYPHDTMELIFTSDIIINFSSTSIKECILLNKPLINFDIKPFERFLGDLYQHDYCIDFSVDFEEEELKDCILKLTNADLSKEYQKAKDLYLFEPGNVSSSILEKCL